ncbi:MAG: HAMP domain-containing histidine kinase [Marinilabiliaceae bacterium]|nr:HAMP domain-containing histidine kinase [Marinilabiliaceae bacterium]
MKQYLKKRRWKFFLILGAVVISIFSLLYTSRLSKELSSEVHKRMKIWSLAYNKLANDQYTSDDFELILEIITTNTNIPVILTDIEGNVVEHRNIDVPADKQEKHLQKVLSKMKKEREPVIISLGDDDKQYLYYSESLLISKLQWFPVVQLFIVFVFMIIAYTAFSTARRWEQDHVWVGMARETAHQLGTPTSSLLGWMDILELKQCDTKYINEMRFDIKRLLTITARFSKIGSKPELENEKIIEVVEQMIEYLRNRSSKLVTFSIKNDIQNDFEIKMCRPLFEWVIENICKNAIDAMEGEGAIDVHIFEQKEKLIIDISDTGKGIARNLQKSVFKPGYSTKPKGWGLGLTLAKRIVEQYHNGKLFIPSSTTKKGTTFRILIPLVGNE